MSLTIIRKVSVTGGTVLRAANNLGDVASAATARTNLGVQSTAEVAAAAATLINPRAPRQALALAGTASPTIASSSAFGTADFTIALDARSTISGSLQVLFSSAAFGPKLYAAADGTMTFGQRSGYSASTSAVGFTAVRRIFWVRTSGVSKLYADNVEVASTADTTDYTAAISSLGGESGAGYFTGTICLLGIANRALSAAERLALYEQGAPAAADYNSASNTVSLITGTNSDFSGAGSWAAKNSGTITITGGKGVIAAMAAQFDGAQLPIVLGGLKKYRYNITLSSLAGGTEAILTGSNGSTLGVLVNGANTGEFTCPAGGYASVWVVRGANAITGVSIDDVTIYPLGLLCAPEANAPGNGYQWRDMSGAPSPADITVPVSGVAWALPDTRPNRVRGTLTWAGTHESKSLLSQRAFPDGAVRTLLTLKSTASTSGSGTTVGSTNTAARWRAAAALTANTKAVATLANQLPAGTADADNDLVVDPDTANFTGSIAVEAHYSITEGT